MGSGENRNQKDEVIIRRPKNVINNLSVGIDIGIADTAADMCPTSFKTKIGKTIHMKDGMPVRLQKKNGVYLILLSTSEVGRLTTRQAEIIDRCSQLGVNYSGKILIHDEQAAAIFTRSL